MHELLLKKNIKDVSPINPFRYAENVLADLRDSSTVNLLKSVYNANKPHSFFAIDKEEVEAVKDEVK